MNNEPKVRIVDICNLGVNGTYTPEPIPEPDPAPDGRITIQITNGAPVRVDPAAWPVVAFGEAGENFDGCRKFEGCAIVVRENVSDGRAVAEGAYVCDGKEDVVVGGISRWKVDGVRQDGLANNIKMIVAYLEAAYGGRTNVIMRAAEKAFASLPAVDL